MTSTITFRGGRLPERPDQPKLMLGPLLHPALPAPPPSADWLTPVPGGLWGMLGNENWGDCGFAGMAHVRIGDVYVNQGRALHVTDEQALAAYSSCTGFDPTAGAPGENPTDNGVVLQDALKWWQKNGFLGEKPLAYARVDLHSKTEVRQAINLFGQLYVGITVTQASEDQFNAGEPWDYVKGSPELGGHCITIGAYDEDGLGGVTWGRVQRMTWRFVREQGDEAWGLISLDDLNPKTGVGARGLSREALEGDFTALTGKRLGG